MQLAFPLSPELENMTGGGYCWCPTYLTARRGGGGRRIGKRPMGGPGPPAFHSLIAACSIIRCALGTVFWYLVSFPRPIADAG